MIPKEKSEKNGDLGAGETARRTGLVLFVPFVFSCEQADQRITKAS